MRFWVRYRACCTAGVLSLADGYRRKQFKAAASDSIYNDETRLFERKGKRPPDNSELCSRLNKAHQKYLRYATGGTPGRRKNSQRGAAGGTPAGEGERWITEKFMSVR